MDSTTAATQRSGRRWGRTLIVGIGLLLVAAGVIGVAAVAWLRVQLGRSLPQTAGERRLPGLTAPVTVARDHRGVPLITGASRVDVARALGFVHAQERFFQMDLSRRRASGELAELVGAAAVPLDRSARLHRMRARARRVVAGAHRADRELLEAYARGVNAGLAALAAPPPEYVLLRVEPRPWRTEDCVLVTASMFFALQDADGVLEARTTLAHEVFPLPLAAFLMSSDSEWDTPLEGPRRPLLWRPAPTSSTCAPRGRFRSPRAAARGSCHLLRIDAQREHWPRGLHRPTPTDGAATTGPSRAVSRPMGARSSPTTCTSGSACRTRGTSPRWPGPRIGASGPWPA